MCAKIQSVCETIHIALLGTTLCGQVCPAVMDLFPESANVYDSYGEMLLLKGDTTKAIESYERALEVNPEYQNAATVLKRLKE